MQILAWGVLIRIRRRGFEYGWDVGEAGAKPLGLPQVSFWEKYEERAAAPCSGCYMAIGRPTPETGDPGTVI